VGSCLTDATREAAPGVPFVGCRYAEARTPATAVAATMVIGGAMRTLIASFNLHSHPNPRHEISIDRGQSTSIRAPPVSSFSRDAKHETSGQATSPNSNAYDVSVISRVGK
jgi:hypothetical protein